MPANARPGDADELRLEHAHWPLIGMLVLTQIAVGMFAGAAALALGNAAFFLQAQAPLAIAAFAILNLGLGVSVLHLGRPLGAWRAFLGLGTSWMSREIFAFGIVAAAAAAFTGASLWKMAARWIPQLRLVESIVDPSQLTTPLAVLAALLGLLGVYCSAMIYVDTRRPFWAAGLTLPKFFGTTFLLGTAVSACVLAWAAALWNPALASSARDFCIAAMIIRAALFMWESADFFRALKDREHPAHRSALTMWNLLRPLALAQPALFAVSVVSGVCAIARGGWIGAVAATVAMLAATASQVIERYFFFTAVVAPRMPGGVAA